MPDGSTAKDTPTEPNMELDFNYKKRQQLISFGHSQWGFKNWNWSVTKQDLDFIDYSNGKYIAGVVAFVSVTVNSLGLRREDVGYATTVSTQKGGAIYNARKGSITNALRETLLGFGGSIASQLIELLEASKMDNQADKRNVLETAHENNENLNLASNTHIGEPKNTLNTSVSQMGFSHRKDSSDSSISIENNQFKGMRSPQRYGGNQQQSDKNNLDKSQNQFPIINNARIISQTNLNEAPNFPANQAASKPNNGFVANHNPKMVAPITQVPPPPPLNIRPNTGPASLTAPHHPSNVCPPEFNLPSAESKDEELRAERIRRQRQKMEEFKSKQMQKNNSSTHLEKTREAPGKNKRASIIFYSSQDPELDESSPPEINVIKEVSPQKVSSFNSNASKDSLKRPFEEI